MAPKSSSNPQRTISSFFAPKAAPSTANQSNLANRSPLPHLTKRSSEVIESIGSDDENTEPSSKRRRVTDNDEHLHDGTKTAHRPTPHFSTQDESVTAFPLSVTDRTSRYLFSTSPINNLQLGEDESAENEQERRRRHDQFVKKLSRPHNPRRAVDTGINEDNAEDGAEDSGGEDGEEDQPANFGKRKASSSRSTGKLTPMVKQYLDLKRQHLDKIIIYQVGYKYLFYGEDARTAGKELSIVCIPGKFRYDEHPSEAHLNRFASASIPLARLHVHVKRLVAAGHKVGVVKQLETAALKAAGDNRNTPFVRKLTNVYTKGTYVDDVEGLDGGNVADASATGTGYLLCLSETNLRGYGDDEKVHVGIVAVQPATGAIIYDDFEDGFMRNEIETRLLHIAPSEYLIVGDLSSATKKLIKHLSGKKSNIFGVKARVEHVERGKTAAAESFSHVSSFYAEKLKSSGSNGEKRMHDLDKIHQFSEHVTICLSAMIKHLTEYGLQHVFNLTRNFQDFNMRTHMLLNGNTLSSLEIYTNQTDHIEKGSLFWRLDRTKTRFGKRMLRNWVGRPLLDKKTLEDRVNAVEELKDSDGTRESDRLKRVLIRIKSDLEKILIRIYYKRAARPEVLGFLQTLQNITNEYAHIKEPSDAGFKSLVLNDAVATLPQLGEPVVEFLGRIRLQSAKEDDKYCFFLEECESEAVIDHKLGIASVEHDLDVHRTDAATKLGRPIVHYTTVAGIEYLIEVENTKATLSKVPASWVKISHTKKCSRFHTPEVLKLLRERDQYKESLAAACDEAFERFMEEISEKYQLLRDCIRSLATLDCLSSLAEIANQPGYCKPEFVDDARIEVLQGRHPMVEQLLLDSYVPNDISLSSRPPSQNEAYNMPTPNALLITGPNMGGKSSYVRSVALISIMGQIGSYVPADSARLGMLDGVFTRMGAFDNMMRGESTFMVELGETSDILKQATRRSLVILDELGRGTSTHDGVAIAEAVLRELVDRGVMTLFITHYQDLARVEKDCGSHLRNVHVKFEENSNEEITFLYEVGNGVAHRSYGLNVARLANVPKAVLEVAAVKSRELEESVSRRKVSNLGRLVAHVFKDGDDHEAAVQRLVGAIKHF